MTSGATNSWTELRRLADQGDADALHRFVDELSGGEVARALSRLDHDERRRVLVALDPHDAAEVIEEIPDAQAVDLVEMLSADEAAAIVSELPSDERADLIAAMGDENAEAILSEMSPSDAADVRALASYPSNCAGGLMVTEILSFPSSATVTEVVSSLQDRAEEFATYDIQYVYVVAAPDERLVGVVRLRDLVLSRPDRSIGDFMIRDPHAVRDDTDLDGLHDFFEHEHLIGVPVTNEAGRLLGVVRRHDLDEAIGDRSDGDYLKSQGILGGEELRSMPMLKRSRRRLSWLSINIVLNIIAASVIAMYQETLSAVIALAVFLPIVSDMSGCSGNQAVAVSIRELTLGLIQPAEVARVWLKEILVGALNGLVLGAIVACAAWAWRGNPWLAAVIGVALMLNTVVAVSIGGTVPLILKRFNVDPALASGPILTTLTDMCGFFLVLSLASLVLPYIAST